VSEDKEEHTDYSNRGNGEDGASNEIGFEEFGVDAFDRRYLFLLLAVIACSFDCLQSGFSRFACFRFSCRYLGAESFYLPPEAGKFFILMASLRSLCPPLADALLFGHTLILADAAPSLTFAVDL
jgi:hypothetical protein